MGAIMHRSLAAPDDMARPVNGGGIDRHDLADHHPVERMLLGGKAEFRRQRGSRLLQLLDIGGDMHALDGRELRYVMRRQPVEEFMRSASIGAARVRQRWRQGPVRGRRRSGRVDLWFRFSLERLFKFFEVTLQFVDELRRCVCNFFATYGRWLVRNPFQELLTSPNGLLGFFNGFLQFLLVEFGIGHGVAPVGRSIYI